MKGMRTPNQCKSHHQKMQKATNSSKVKDLIMYLKYKHSICGSKQEKQLSPQKATQLDVFGELDNSLKLLFSVSHVGIQLNVKINFEDISTW